MIASLVLRLRSSTSLVPIVSTAWIFMSCYWKAWSIRTCWRTFGSWYTKKEVSPRMICITMAQRLDHDIVHCLSFAFHHWRGSTSLHHDKPIVYSALEWEVSFLHIILYNTASSNLKRTFQSSSTTLRPTTSQTHNQHSQENVFYSSTKAKIR